MANKHHRTGERLLCKQPIRSVMYDSAGGKRKNGDFYEPSFIPFQQSHLRARFIHLPKLDCRVEGWAVGDGERVFLSRLKTSFSSGDHILCCSSAPVLPK